MTSSVEPQEIRADEPSLRMILVNGHWYVPESDCRRYVARLRGEVPPVPTNGRDPLITLSEAARLAGVTAKTLLRRVSSPIREAAKSNDDAQRIIKRMDAARAAKAARPRTDKPELAVNAV
jgi:hypothetical protein